MPMPADEFLEMVRKVVKEEVDACFDRLLDDVKVAMRDVIREREADDAHGEP